MRTWALANRRTPFPSQTLSLNKCISHAEGSGMHGIAPFRRVVRLPRRKREDGIFPQMCSTALSEDDPRRSCK